MRSRNENGRYRHKRGDAQTGNLEKKYGVRSDMKLETLRNQREEGPPLMQMQREQQHKE